MARKKKTKTTGSLASKRGSDRRKAERRAAEELFWSKIYNGFKKFLESPFNQ
jgi:hypothetical protein